MGQAPSEGNKGLARAAIGLWSTGDVSASGTIFAPGYVMRQHHHPQSGGDLDLAALLAFLTSFRRAFPDLVDTIDRQLAEGELVATHFTSTGTHSGPYQDLAPTGRRMSWSGIIIDRIADGRIVESWCHWDMMGMLQQMGAVSLKTG